MPYRCVKCSQSHGPGNCKVPKKELNTEEFVLKDQITGTIIKRIGLPVKCANCDKEGHVASSYLCPKRREIKKRLDERRTERSRTNVLPTRMATSFRNGVSYANVVDNNRSEIPRNIIRNKGPGLRMRASEMFEKINADCAKYLGKDFVSCMEKIGDFAEEYSRITDGGEKTRALFGLLISMRLNG